MVLLNGSANRDERHFADGDSFDIHREIGRHLSFGYGIHLCLGARWPGWRAASRSTKYCIASPSGRSTTQGPSGPTPRPFGAGRRCRYARRDAVPQFPLGEEHSMNLDDMILVSIDDHMIEPPDMYENHVPKKWLDDAPKVVHEDGIDRWVFQGEKTSTSFGMSATVGWPSGGMGLQPGHLHRAAARLLRRARTGADMNANGVLGSMCFPTMAGWNARTFSEAQ